MLVLQLLVLYGLYKQATVGDVNISQPWKVQVEARAKYDAWEKNKGMKTDEAMTGAFPQAKSSSHALSLSLHQVR